MRCWVVAVLLAGCGASIDTTVEAESPRDADVGDDSAPTDPPVDSPGGPPVGPIDAPPDAAPPPDAPPDARACAGGNASAVAPDGSCLVRFDQAETFAAASAACIAFGAQLAILTDAQRDTVARTLAGSRDVFIGLTDQIQETAFVWSDGTPLAFANFFPGEPNNANGAFQEDCIIINGARGGRWDDRPCAPTAGTQVPGKYPYFCLF